MIFKLFGIKFQITVPFAVLMAFLLITDKTGLMSASLTAILVHELGHIFAMKLLKTAPKEILFRSGGLMIVGKTFLTSKEALIVALAGPITNLIFSAVFFAIGAITDTYIILCFSAVQFLIGAINLFPVKGLDGGTVLKQALMYLNCKNKEILLSLISIFTSAVVTVVGLAVAVRNVSNPSLLLLGIYLVILNLIKYNSD